MEDKKTVERFLGGFKQKLGVFDVLFLDQRGKNAQALADLGITPIQRRQVLADLKVEDYSQGPLEESFYGGMNEMWVFGKWLKSAEIYIKITLARPGTPVICISFHPAEYPMKYPFRAKSSSAQEKKP